MKIQLVSCVELQYFNSNIFLITDMCQSLSLFDFLKFNLLYKVFNFIILVISYYFCFFLKYLFCHAIYLHQYFHAPFLEFDFSFFFLHIFNILHFLLSFYYILSGFYYHVAAELAASVFRKHVWKLSLFCCPWCHYKFFWAY